MSEDRLKTRIDACRPGSQDVDLPEMTDLAEAIGQENPVRQWYGRSQAVDAALMLAFRDVPIPDGLEQRLLDSLPAGPEAVEPAKSRPDAPVLPHSGSASQAAWRRRYWLLSIAATAAVLFVAFFLSGRSTETMASTESFAREVIGWLGQADQLDWTDDFRAEHLQAFPFDGTVRSGPVRWAQTVTQYDKATVVYDITPIGDSPAYLFCIRKGRNQTTFEKTPPTIPFSTTGGVSIGAWERDGLVYVLAVRGSQRRYQDFIDSRMLAFA